MPKRIGLIGYRVCKRCHEGYLPSHGSQKLCPYCQSHPVKRKSDQTCRVRECLEPVGKKGGFGFCERHYSQLIRWPREKARLAAKREGVVVCETFKHCQVFFKPTSRFHLKREKYCPNCRHSRKKI